LAVEPGETLLVTGASGGVGGFAVQIASALGARVVAVARPESDEFVRSLGAVATIADAADAERVDALLDCVGGDVLTRAISAVTDGGRAVPRLPPAGDPAERDITVSFVWGRQDRGRLQALGRLADGGGLRVELEAVLPLEDAARAHELIEAGGRR